MLRPIPRLALFYATYFSVVGVLLPFWPAWLESRGMSKPQIGMLAAIGTWARAIANPLVAHRADRRSVRRSLMLWLGWAAFAAFALYALPGGFWWLCIVGILFGMAHSPLMVLGESATLLATRGEGMHYGRVRSWGSLAFVLAATGGGVLFEGRPESLIWWVTLGLLLLTAISCYLVPDERPGADDDGAPPARRPALALLRHPAFVVFILATAAVQASHAAYYNFGTLYWRAAGHSDRAIGWLWSEGVIAEIALFWFSSWILKRFSSATLIGVAGLAGLVRWLVIAHSTDYAVLVLVQPLHGLTFGATHLGAMRFIAQRVRSSASVSAQSLYAALANGAAMGVGSYASGYLYEHHQGGAFSWMAASAGIGALAAVALFVLLRRLNGRLG